MFAVATRRTEDWPAHPIFGHAAGWCREHAPDGPPQDMVIVHGDYKVGNFIWRDDRIVALLDLEGATLGDPRQDLGYACHPAMREAQPELMAMLAPLADLLGRYESICAVSSRVTWLSFEYAVAIRMSPTSRRGTSMTTRSRTAARAHGRSPAPLDDRVRGPGGMTLELEGSAMMPAVTSQMTRLPDGVPSNHDHRWSSRPSTTTAAATSTRATSTTSSRSTCRRATPDLASAPVPNDYLLDHGEVVLLKAGEGGYELDGWYTKRLVYELEDERGRTHVFNGEPKAALVLPTWPNQYNVAAVTGWTHEGETGWGEYKWHWETSAMQAHARGA